MKAWLKGHQFDLEVLTELFLDGDVRVVKEGDEYYLAAADIAGAPDGRKFYEVAPDVLQRVNGIVGVMRPNDYQPVELTGGTKSERTGMWWCRWAVPKLGDRHCR